MAELDHCGPDDRSRLVSGPSEPRTQDLSTILMVVEPYGYIMHRPSTILILPWYAGSPNHEVLAMTFAGGGGRRGFGLVFTPNALDTHYEVRLRLSHQHWQFSQSFGNLRVSGTDYHRGHDFDAAGVMPNSHSSMLAILIDTDAGV